MTSVNMQITQTNQGNNDSSENIKRKEEFSIHIEATSEQASKDHTAQQYHAREGTGKPHVDTIHTGDTTATVSKTEKVPAITPPDKPPTGKQHRDSELIHQTSTSSRPGKPTSGSCLDIGAAQGCPIGDK
jgi:hypothetical protein